MSAPLGAHLTHHYLLGYISLSKVINSLKISTWAPREVETNQNCVILMGPLLILRQRYKTSWTVSFQEDGLDVVGPSHGQHAHQIWHPVTFICGGTSQQRVCNQGQQRLRTQDQDQWGVCSHSGTASANCNWRLWEATSDCDWHWQPPGWGSQEVITSLKSRDILYRALTDYCWPYKSGDVSPWNPSTTFGKPWNN